MPCTTAPPTSGPIATAVPLTPDHTPIAIPRRSAGKAAASSVSVSGVRIAAPAPCTARADRDGGPADARPHADRHPAPLGREGRRKQRERERREDRGAGALHRAC